MTLTPRQQLAALGITLAEAEADEPEQERPRFTEVERGAEFHRIFTLPRRPVPDPDGPEAHALADEIFQALAKTEDPYPGRPRTIAALSLRECWENKGGFLMLRVGAGKTWIAAMLPSVIPTERPLYICPAKMCKAKKQKGKKVRQAPVQTEWAKYRQHWHMREAHEYPICSYEELASPRAGEMLKNGQVVRASLLERMRPTMIVLDESHMCANTSSVITKRIDDYVKKYPETIVVAMTGTPFKTKIGDAAHIMRWCLGPERMPLPNIRESFNEFLQWGSFLDAKEGMGPRCSVGCLVDFLNPEERKYHDRYEGLSEARSVVRRAIARRILETPGVIGTQDPPLDTLLTVEEWGPQREDPALCEAIAEMRKTWALPDGTEFADGIEFARHINTLSMGFYNIWSPAPRQEYRDSRNQWAKWCRRMIRANKRGVDSEARMKSAVRDGTFDDEGVLAAWEDEVKEYRATHKPLLEPPSVPVWESNEAIEAARAWIAEGHQGLIWVDYIGLGERLADELKIPYYGEQGIDKKTGTYIEQHPGGPAIASKAANGTGKNLQFLWHEALWFCVPCEQSLGRMHRAGQRSPVVRNWIYIGCVEHLKRYYAAKSTKATFAEDMTLQPQKLRYAQTSMPRMHDLEMRGGARWVMKENDDV